MLIYKPCLINDSLSPFADIKVSKIAENPVKLDWVPPDVTPDLVSAYMDQLGHENIPVSGSEAASQRIKRLEFQVPPHDLDAALCHNLTDKETEQLQKYVESIRENCVGQGNVIRLGDKQRGVIGYVAGGDNSSATHEHEDDLPPPPSPIVDKNPFQTNHCLMEELFRPDGSLQVQLQPDQLLGTILHSDLVRSIRELPMSATERTTVSSTMPEMVADFIASPHLTPATKGKLRDMKIDTTGIRSAVLNGPIYDRLFKDLRDRNISFKDDPLLGPLSQFRDNYRTDEAFRNDADNFVRHLPTDYDDHLQMPANVKVVLTGGGDGATPLRHMTAPSPFYSPVNVRQRVPGTRESALLTQETPMRKLRFPSSFSQLYDPVYPQIASIVEDPSRLVPGSAIVIHERPLLADFPQHCKLTTPTKQKLGAMGLNSDAVRSGVINGPQYDQLFRGLRANRIRFGEDALLGPMEAFRDEYLADPELRHETNQFTKDTAEELPETLVASKSNDSGFGSVPPTPNYGSYPGRMAQPGAFAQIPGIEDLNMYPEVMPAKGTSMAPLIDRMAGLKGPSSAQDPASASTDVTHSLNMNCKQCAQDIRLGEVVVKAQRAGKDVAWHPQCFVCHKCNELLADLVYFFHGGNVYCARDLAETLKIPRCKACDELIFTNEYTAAENATFHIKHFCCFQCDSPLAGQKYIPDEKTNMPMCLKCFNEFHAEKCRKCKKVIGPTEQGVSWKELHWHGACFTCAGQGCDKSLIGSRFCVKNEMTFCSADCVNSVINA